MEEWLFMLCSNYKFLLKKNLCYYFNTYYLYVEMLHSCNNVVPNWIYESCQNDFLKVDSLKWFICQQIKIFGWIDWEAWIKNCEVLFFFLSEETFMSSCVKFYQSIWTIFTWDILFINDFTFVNYFGIHVDFWYQSAQRKIWHFASFLNLFILRLSI
jgi:hypothetical protein